MNPANSVVEETLRKTQQAKQFYIDLVETNDQLERDKKAAEDLVKDRECELVEERKLVTLYQSKNDCLLQDKTSLEKEINTLKLNSESQQKEISALKEQLKKSEESLEQLTKNNVAKCNQELLVKHNKLREYVKNHLTALQQLTKTVKTDPGKHQRALLNNKLKLLTAKFTKKFAKMKTSKQKFLHILRVNKRLMLYLTKMLKTPQVVTKLQCKCCSKFFLSWKRLQTHRRVVHTVQKARKFFQKQSIARRNQVVRLLKRIKNCIKLRQSNRKLCQNLELGSTKTCQNHDVEIVEMTNLETNVHQLMNNPPESSCNIFPIITLPDAISALSIDINENTTNSNETVEFNNSQLSPDTQILTETPVAVTPSISIQISATTTPTSSESPKKFQCSGCSTEFLLMGGWQRHGYVVQAVLSPKMVGKRGCELCKKLLRQQSPLQTQNSPSSWKPHKKRKVSTSRQQPSQNREGNSYPPKLNKELPLFVTTQKHEVDPIKRIGFHCRCGSSFGNARGLAHHIRWFTVDRKFVCPTCSQRFVYLSNLKQHMQRFHKERNFPEDMVRGCSECGAWFGTPKELNQHQQEFHSSKIGNMPQLTPYPYAANADVTPPVASSSRKNPEPTLTVKHPNFTPPLIQSSVPTTQNIQVWETRKHAFTHAEEPGIYSCKCGLRFKAMDTLHIHSRFFALGKRFPCLHCDMRFPILCDVNVHVRKHHRDTHPKVFYMGCQFCGVIFIDRKEYRKHLIAPDGKRRFGNCFCPMKISAMRKPKAKEIEKIPKDTLAVAINLEPKFACRVCKKRFLYTRTLYNHMVAAHKIVENLGAGCHICGEFFLDHMDLAKHHRMVHNTTAGLEVEMKFIPPKEKEPMHSEVSVNPQDEALGYKFKCKCGKPFASKWGMLWHIRTKKVGGVFVCSWCPGESVRFTQHGSLKNHIRKFHPEVTDKMANFACGICGKSFSKRFQVSQHRKIEHGTIR